MRLSLGLGLPPAVKSFSLNSFMGSQTDGFYYDFTKLDRHFQEYVGPTAADAAGEPIGLALSQRQWGNQTLAQVAAAASEIRSNGAVSTIGAPTPATYNTSTGEGTVERTDSSNTSGVKITAAVGRIYAVDIEKTGGAATISLRTGSVIGTGFSLGASRATYYVYVDSGTGIYVASSTNGTSGSFTLHSCKLIPGVPGLQSSATLRPVFQTLGAKGDGTDDNLLTSYLAVSGANFLGARDTTVPTTLAATQIMLGASGSGANRCFVGVDTSGFACGGVGSDSTTTIVGTTDLRNTVADIFLTFNGTTVRLIVNGVVEYEAAQNSTPTTSIPFRLFANNNNGTAGSFYAGYVPQFLVGREFITAATAKNLGR